MRYIWYGFLGLFSLGFFTLIAGVIGMIYVFSYFGKDLPDYSQLKDYQPPIVTRLYAGDGRLMAEFAQQKRVFMPIELVPDRVKHAFIAAEDKNFYKHPGVDLFAIGRAALSNLKNVGRGRRPEGASTITQQVAKNFLLTNEVSYSRKIKEAILAYRMEKAMTKDDLLELYLNEIYLGARSYGVTAAALQYFGKTLDELSVAEAAYLAALPKAPNNYHPVHDHDAALERRNWVIDRMTEDGYISAEEAVLEKAMPLESVQRDLSNIVRTPYFTEEVRRMLESKYGQESLYGGGLVVRSSLDPRLQDIAVRALRDGLIAYDRRRGWRGPVANFVSLENWQEKLAQTKRPAAMLTEWKLAMVLEVDQTKAVIGFELENKAEDAEGNTEGNDARNENDPARTAEIPLSDLAWAREYRNGGYALGPPITSVKQVLSAGDVVMVKAKEGSPTQYTLKQIPLIQGALIAMDPHTGRILAMQGGWKHQISEFNRATQADRQPGSAFKPFVYLAALDKGFTPATLVLDAPFAIQDRPGNIWSPSNYSNEYYGPTPIRVGVEKSRNLMTVRLADFLGMEVISDYANRFGIVDQMPHHLANALGASETTLFRLTTAYAMLVNGGKRISPTFIDRIQDRHGQTIFRHDNRACQTCGDMIRWEGQRTPQVPDDREQVVDPRTAYQTVSMLEGVIQRGTGARIRALGRPLAGKTGTTNKSKDVWFIGFSPDLVVGIFAGFDEPRSLGKRETGSSVAVPIFKDFMREALADQPPTPFRIPPGIRHVQINADTGVRAKPGDESVIWEAFVIGTEPTDEMYILDGHGINLMPSVMAQPGTPAEEATTGTGGLY